MKKNRKEETEVIEAMIGHIGNALVGQLDPRGAKELMIGILAVGGVVAALSIEPALLAGAMGLVNVLRDDDKESTRKAKAAIQYVRNRGYVTVEQGKDEVIVRMTKKGMIFAKRHTLRFLPKTIEIPRNWDKHWRLIMFDIPATERSLRDGFRSLIKRIGAVQLQKSVWIYPYNCGEQINLFKSFFRLGDEELRFIETSSVGSDMKLRNYFKL